MSTPRIMEKQPHPCDTELSKEEIESVNKFHNAIAGVGLYAKSYPLELLAATASRLLEGEDYKSAVWRAAWLLKTCEEFLDVASHNKAWVEESAKQTIAAVAESRTSKRIPFSVALEKIYARSRLDRNLDAHRAFLWHKSKATGNRQYLATAITQDEDRGFLPSEVARLRREYQAIPKGKWQAIVTEYKCHNAPLEKKVLDRPETGKKRPPAGKTARKAKK